MKRSKYIVFESFGDAGKNMAGTAVVNALAFKYPDRKIVVMTNILDIWMHHPAVYRVYDANKVSYFYDDYIRDCDTIICRQDPYKSDDYIHKNGTLIESWCKVCGLDKKADAEAYKKALPSLVLTFREKEVLRRLTYSQKPLVLLHMFEYGPKDPPARQFARNIPFDLGVKISEYATKKGYDVIMPNIPDMPVVPNVKMVQFGPKLLLSLPMVVKYSFVAESAFVHSSVALEKAGESVGTTTVIWSGSKHTEHGWDTQKNIYPVNAPQTTKDFIAGFSEVWNDDLLLASLPTIDSSNYYFDEIISHIK